VRRAAPCALALLLLAPVAWAGNARILVTGTYAPETLDFAESRTFVEYAEEGSLQAGYTTKHGFGGELGVEYDFIPRFGLRASLSYLSREQHASFQARLPHPLYLDHPRTVSGTVGGQDYREAVGSLDLVLILGNGPVQVSLLAGAAVFRVDAALLGDVSKNEEYPYDSVEITGVTTRRLRDIPVGYGGAVGIDWRLGRHFGLGAQARYSRAQARLEVSDQETITFDAGGLQVGFGLRLLF
jgi:Outer membrane protein beta-barrel domain